METNKTKKHKVNYSQISNFLLNDKDLSLKAKGLYSFMFSKPDDFNFTIRSLSKLLLEGQRSIMATLQELKDKGWVSYTKFHDGSGEYYLNENPNLHNSSLDEPNCQNPNLHNSNLLKQQRINNTVLYNKKDNNNKDENLIDFTKLLLYYNSVLNKSCRVFPENVKKAFNLRVKEGYLKEDIKKVIDNASNDELHKENNFKYVTLEFLSRPKIFERYASMEHKKPFKKEKGGFTNH